MPAEIQLQRVKAGRGFVWLHQGLRVFAHRPMAFSLLLAAALFLLFILTIVPVVGPLIALASLPLVWLGFMIATQLALRGKVPMPDVFLLPLRVDRARTVALIKLCVMFCVGLFAISLLSAWLAEGRFEAILQPPDAKLSAEQAQALMQKQVQALLNDPSMQRIAYLSTALLALLSVPFWHAMALVHWGGHSAGKALFFSTVAVWRAKGAFLVHGITCIATLSAVSALCTLILALLGRPDWVPAIAASMMLMFATVFLASLFFTFVDAFVATPGGVPAAEPDQVPPP